MSTHTHTSGFLSYKTAWCPLKYWASKVWVALIIGTYKYCNLHPTIQDLKNQKTEWSSFPKYCKSPCRSPKVCDLPDEANYNSQHECQPLSWHAQSWLNKSWIATGWRPLMYIVFNTQSQTNSKIKWIRGFRQLVSFGLCSDWWFPRS